MLLQHSSIPLVLIALVNRYHAAVAQESTLSDLVEQPLGSIYQAATCMSQRSSNRSCPIHNEFQNSSSQSPSFRSDGLVYKFDEVTVKPILQSTDESKELYGFVQQRCYDHQTEPTEDPFCIYLNYGFNQGRGMVILCRRSALQGIIEQTFKPESSLLKEMNRSSGKFNVVDMPEKGGKGMIASQKYLIGDLILTSYPVLILTLEDELWEVSESFDLEKTLVDYLPLETRAEIATLHGEGETEVSWMMSVIWRNSFALTLEDEPYMALFLDPSGSLMRANFARRANHDCRPNTIYHTDQTTLKLNMYAAREIEVGQELVTTYLNIRQPTETRRAHLREHYGFECQCSVCSLPEHLIKFSDSRLNQIKKLLDELIDWSSTSNANTYTSRAEDLLELYKLEGLEIDMADPYLAAAMRYNAIKNLDKTKLYASLAVLHEIRISGVASQNLANMISLRDFPEAHWSYDYRYGESMYYNFCQCGLDGSSLLTKSTLCIHQLPKKERIVAAYDEKDAPIHSDK
ncbi:uncharacterized protein MELLADRAFT_68703 [Melampsora larici-populina 98AG31]|uniref:SET domain-containing protein n=1 Tax=Melampsora larici-populina (strain 98AG31 / pathotype 3-4-7) TaxID=747676 RepID=F4S7W1_MELLP|nr:uncharacterized protein MELLADRAFT_68703 [Melampsora larici-populina 98AG31]EGF99295.1 hypothetical protein MELLADRAFT_68703 [Melampsora larici-populina 98AG31]